MTQNIEQRTTAAVTKYEGAASKVNKFAESDEVIITESGHRNSFPKITREFKSSADNQLIAQEKEFQDRFSTLPPIEWTPGLSVTNKLQTYTHADANGVQRTYLPDPAKLPFDTSQTWDADWALGLWSEANPVTTDTAIVANNSSRGRKLQERFSDIKNVLDFGADPTGVDDSTDAFNRATLAGDDYDETVFRRNIVVPDGRYRIDGKVYVRKGQTLSGSMGSSHLYMGGTGSIVMGWKSDDTEDPSGRPPRVSGLWIEGGYQPIFVEVSGWTIDSCFFSFPVAGVFATGSDGHIFGCTFDGGSGLLALSGGAHTLSDCIFFIGTNQLTLGGDQVRKILHSTTISNCVFNFAQYSAIRISNGAVKNVTISGCTFNLNEQFKTHSAFIKTEWSGGDYPQPEADIIIDSCSFVNGKEYAIDFSSGSGHNVTISNCTFDGHQPQPVWAQATEPKGFRTKTSGIYTLSDCTFRNLNGQPVSIEGSAEIHLNMNDCHFESNDSLTTTADISTTNSNRSSTLRLRNIKGCGRQLYELNEQVLASFHAAGLDDWYAIENTSGRDYIRIPYYGATIFELDSSISPSSAHTQYRLNERFVFGVSHDYIDGKVQSLTDIQSMYKSRSPLGLASDYQVEFDRVGGGKEKVYTDSGYLVLSWPDTYTRSGKSRINISPVLSSRAG